MDDKFSPTPWVFLSNSITKAAMDGSMLVSLGLVCASRWSEVFKSDDMKRNYLDDFSKDPGSYSRRIRRRSFVLFSPVKFRRTRKKCNFLDLDPLRVRKQNRRQALCYMCTGFS